jgi:pimeloyl-ACP methyl ester carboxylesterase
MKLRNVFAGACAAALFFASAGARSQATTRVVDLPTRPGVTERMVVIAPDQPKAALILLAGGPGRVRITDNGAILNEGNFLVRSRQLFAQHGNAVIVLDTPSDHSGGMPVSFRDSDDHVTDLVAATEWARKQWSKPVWLVGTSRGTQSAAHMATNTAGTRDSPDGIVLTSTILDRSRRDPGIPVPEEPLGKLRIPVLVVHHEQDPCPICAPSLLPRLMDKLPAATSKLLTFSGGQSTGDPCEAFSYHGYNGIEPQVVDAISDFIAAH